MRRVPFTAIWPFFAAAAGACGERRTMADCEGLASPEASHSCRQAVLAALPPQPEAVERALAECGDPATRDLLRLKLVVADPASSVSVCPTVEGEQARRWCADLQGRAHLWRTGADPADGPRGQGRGRP